MDGLTPAPNPQPRAPNAATDFADRWAAFAEDPRLKVTFGYHRQFPAAAGDPFTVAHIKMPDLKKLAKEFFSWGLVHGEHRRRQLEELL